MRKEALSERAELLAPANNRQMSAYAFSEAQALIQSDCTHVVLSDVQKRHSAPIAYLLYHVVIRVPA